MFGSVLASVTICLLLVRIRPYFATHLLPRLPPPPLLLMLEQEGPPSIAALAVIPLMLQMSTFQGVPILAMTILPKLDLH
jgi:hypothetical protein